jgi:hypothetical protein
MRYLAPGIVLLALLATGCETLRGTPLDTTGTWLDRSGEFEAQAVKTGPLAKEFDVVWDLTQAALLKAQWDIDPEETSHENGYIVSRWDEHLAPFRFQGTRRRVELKILPVEGTTMGMLEVHLRVHQQRNENMDAPLESAAAEWADIEPDMVRAEQVVFHIQRLFKKPGDDEGS